MIVGAVETTAGFVTCLLHDLAKHPEAQQQWYDGSIGKPSESHEFKRRCQRESLRLHPISLGISRRIPKDVPLSGYDVPAKTHCSMVYPIASRLAENFEDPLSYKPERWIRRKGLEEETSMMHWSNQPFGFGIRKCIGHKIAFQEGKILIDRILNSFRLEFEGEIKVKESMPMVPETPLPFKFIPRENN